uniref:Small ribosomal subunit protein bS20c n=1 Tax=Galaxaura rugosa TaxID=268570 RepID=A0A1G4NTC0_9FLOR|nr:Ribosomal protein S20 [Galaxaura rugosa]SCW21759.1 Ribosomal protein S20 [Galaxaura rugosa]
MAKNLSVIKSIATSKRKRYLNKTYKSTIRTLTKKFVTELQQLKDYNNKDQLYDMVSSIYSKIDKAVKKGILHNNNAARKKSYLAKMIK